MESKRPISAGQPFSALTLDTFENPHRLECGHVDNYKDLMRCLIKGTGDIKCPHCRQLTPVENLLSIKGLDNYDKFPDQLVSENATLSAKLAAAEFALLQWKTFINATDAKENKENKKTFHPKFLMQSSLRFHSEKLIALEAAILTLETKRSEEAFNVLKLKKVILNTIKKIQHTHSAANAQLITATDIILNNPEFENFPPFENATEYLDKIQAKIEFFKNTEDMLVEYKELVIYLRSLNSDAVARVVTLYGKWVLGIQKITEIEQQAYILLEQQNNILKTRNNRLFPDELLIDTFKPHRLSPFTHLNAQLRKEYENPKATIVAPLEVKSTPPETPVESLELRLANELAALLKQNKPRKVNAFLQNLEDMGGNIKKNVLAQKIMSSSFLMYAVCSNCDTRIIKILLRNGANPNTYTYRSSAKIYALPLTTLFAPWQTLSTNPQTSRWLHENRKKIELIINYNANVNLPTVIPNGQTPLYSAIMTNDAELVYKLLELGADPRITYLNYKLYEADIFDAMHKIQDPTLKNHLISVLKTRVAELNKIDADYANLNSEESKSEVKLELKEEKTVELKPSVASPTTFVTQAQYRLQQKQLRKLLHEEESYIANNITVYHEIGSLPKKINNLDVALKQKLHEYSTAIPFPTLIPAQQRLAADEVNFMIRYSNIRRNMATLAASAIKQTEMTHIQLNEKYQTLQNALAPLTKIEDKIDAQIDLLHQSSKSFLRTQHSFSLWHSKMPSTKLAKQLYKAVESCDKAAVINLLSQGANPRLEIFDRNCYRRSSLDLALVKAIKKKEYVEIVNLLGNPKPITQKRFKN